MTAGTWMRFALGAPPPLTGSTTVDALAAVAGALALTAGSVGAAGRRAVAAAARREQHAREERQAAEAARADAEARAAGVIADNHRLAAEADRRAADADQLEEDRRRVAAEAERLASLVGAAAYRQRALGTLWALTELEHAWDRRDQAAVTPTVAPAAVDPAGGVSDAIADEVDRIRDDRGTPGQVTGPPVAGSSPAEALLAVRTVQVLLGAVARRCDHYQVALADDGSRLEVVVRCEGFDGGPGVIEDAKEVARLLQAGGSGADVAVEGGALEARFAFPRPAAE